MVQAGIVAITDDGHCVQNHELMRRAVEYARMFDLPVLDHCQDYSLVGDGVMHEGYWSTVLGLPGWPAAGEEIIVLRNIRAGGTLRLGRFTASISELRGQRPAPARGKGARRCRLSRARFARITSPSPTRPSAASTPTTKMNPPLRTRAKTSMRSSSGIADGTITILCQRPRARTQTVEKEVEFDRAPFGILGLETEFGLFHLPPRRERLKRHRACPRLIELLTINPARLLKLDRGTLSVGKRQPT